MKKATIRYCCNALIMGVASICVRNICRNFGESGRDTGNGSSD